MTTRSLVMRLLSSEAQVDFGLFPQRPHLDRFALAA
jgi:hypothetical protein